MKGERFKLAIGVSLLAVGVVSGIWFTERLRVYPGPPLEVTLGKLENPTGEASLEDALELLLDEGRFVLGEAPAHVLGGRIERDGERYRIDVHVTELETGEVLAEAVEIASDADEIPSAFERLSAALRRELAREGI